ncbi:MAG: hypothetical protein ACJ75A_16250 [Actinomycetes bacterium]
MAWLVPAGRAVGTVLRDPVIVILVLAGAAELLAGDPLVDGLVLLTVAAALARDRVRGRPPGGVPIAAPEWADRLLRARPTPALVIGGLLYSVAAGGLARFSWPVMVAVAVPGVVGVASAWYAAPRPPVGTAPIRQGGAAGWAAVFVALGLWELGAWLLQPSLTTGSPAHPTISILLDPLLGSHPGRSVGFAAWLALGWFLVRR